MDTVTRSGRTEVDTTVSGTGIKPMDKESLCMLTVMFMRASGTTIKLTDMELIDMLMVLLMSASGQKISNMVAESKSGLMVPSTKACIKTAKNMATAP